VADVRRLVGINAGVLDQNLSGGTSTWDFSSASRAVAISGRFTRALMYPAPATSSLSKPSIGPMPLMISSAIFRGALRNFFASSKASGMAYSPSSTLGGCSTTILTRSRS